MSAAATFADEDDNRDRRRVDEKRSAALRSELSRQEARVYADLPAWELVAVTAFVVYWWIRGIKLAFDLSAGERYGSSTYRR